MYYYFVPMHIGQLIKAKAKELNVGTTELARRLKVTKQNVYGIFNRESIDTELLDKIGRILDYDFFQHFISTRDVSVNDLPKYPDLEHDVKHISRQLRDVQEKYELLKALYEQETGKKLPFSK